MLCKFSGHLDLDKAASDEGAPHHRTLADLVEFAANGCELCREIGTHSIFEQSSIEDDSDEDSQITRHFYDNGQFVTWKTRSKGKEVIIATRDIFTTDGMR
jgi:hypothetical protein